MTHKQMTDQELLAIVSNAEQDAIFHSGEFASRNARVLKDYNQDPYGDEVEDQSQVISPDVQDVVEADMPSLARVFLGSSKPITFKAHGSSEEEISEIDSKNTYVHWLIMEQSWSYKVIFNWMKDADIQSNGVVKYFVEDSTKTETHKFTGVSELELTETVESLRGEDVDKIDITGQTPNDDGTFDIEFVVTKGRQEIKIINVPPEQFLISRSANDLETAELVGDRVSKTRGQLLAEGFKRKLINMLPTISTDRNESSEMEIIRNRDNGGVSEEASIADWANELVELRDLYVMVDFDGDGIAERRHILKSGNHILVNEPFDHVPYASLSCLLMPHRAIGRSRAELTQQTQRVKTVVMRQTLDNMYLVNHPRNVVSSDVNIDDMLHVRPNGIVRLRKGSNVPPNMAVSPLVTPYVGDKSLQIIQYLDSVRAQSTGTLMASQGLDSDAIAKETATRFTGIRDDAQAKIELVARTFAETGFRKLYEGVAWLVSRFHDSETEIEILGEELPVNPSNWKHRHSVVSNVGLGSGNSDQMVSSLQGLLGIQMQLKAAGSSMVDEVKLFNTLEGVTKGLGFKEVERYFNDPEKPDDLLQAENEILRGSVEQLQQMVQQLQNPLREAEEVRAQAQLIEAKGKAGLEAAKITENVRQFDIEAEQKARKQEDDLAFNLTKLEADTGKDIPGSTI